MPLLIKDKQFLENDSPRLVPLDEYLASPEKPQAGVLVDAGEEIEALADNLSNIPLIALNFPAFSDGRAYSSANMLRRQYNYQGEIRAVGDVRIDQLEQMARCGFDAFELADGQNSNLALTKLDGYSYNYQQTIDREPLFRQR